MSEGAVEYSTAVSAFRWPLRLPNFASRSVLWCVALGTFTVPLRVAPDRRGFPVGQAYALVMWVGVVDVLLALALLAAGASTVRRILSRTSFPLIDGGALLVVALTISSIVHPVDRGIGFIVRLAGAVVVADWISRGDQKFLRTIGTTVASLGLFQYGLGVAQLVLGRSIGLWVLGEREIPFYPFGSSRGPFGTFFHCYVLAGFVLMSMAVSVSLALRHMMSKRLALAVSFAAASAAVYCFSRVAVVGTALVCCVVIIDAVCHREHRRFAVAVVGVVSVGALLTFGATKDGWAVKRSISQGAGISSHRGTLLHDNIAVFLRHPWIGVGTGGYALSIIDEGQALNGIPKPPHNAPIAALTESGLLSLPALLVDAVALAFMFRRGQWFGIIAVAGVLTPLMLEQFTWNTPEGMLMVGIAFGVGSIGSRWREPATRSVARAAPFVEAPRIVSRPFGPRFRSPLRLIHEGCCYAQTLIARQRYRH